MGVDFLPFVNTCMVFKERLWWIETIDAGNGRDDDTIGSADKTCNRSKAFLLNSFVDGHLFIDVQVTFCEICLRLVVVVMRNEVFNSILREVASNFVIQLPCKRLVVTENECRNIQSLDHVGHGEGLAASCHTEKDTPLLTILELLNQIIDCTGLIARGLEFTVQSKPLH
ncbi:MAG: Uncharacterised protein [Candidatus Poseidoniaceae archaeon]|nr:MAG: Uncharacterised protein [Candidatus Poseidoniaceae archaeon]